MKKTLLLAGLLASKLTYAQDITAGLVAYLPFNGTASDASPNGLNGIIHGATLTTDMNGKPNSAYYFNGNSNYIDIPNDAKLSPASFSYSVWIKPEANSNPFQIYPILTKGKYNDTVNIQNTIGLFADEDVIYEAVKTDNCELYYNDDNINDQEGTFAFNMDTWYHLIATYSAGTMKIYVNGNLIKEGTGTSIKPALSCASPFTIGAEPVVVEVTGGSGPVVGTAYFQGSIDEVRIYDRAVTLAEAKLLYALPTGLEKTSNLPLQEMVYPNPSMDGKFYLSQKLQGVEKITVADMTGNEVAPAYSNNESVDLSNAVPGLYTLRVTTSSGVYVGKIQR